MVSRITDEEVRRREFQFNIDRRKNDEIAGNHLKTRHVYDILISGYRVIYLTGRNALVNTASSPVLGISDISNFIRMYLL